MHAKNNRLNTAAQGSLVEVQRLLEEGTDTSGIIYAMTAAVQKGDIDMARCVYSTYLARAELQLPSA